MYTNDKLSRAMKYFYYKPPKVNFGMPEIAILQELAAKREGIRKGLEDSWTRRTYHSEYVTNVGNKVCNIHSSEQFGRKTVYSDRSYYADDHGYDECRPFAIQLTGRKHHEVWVYGYDYKECEGCVVFLDWHDCKEDAMYQAEREAESSAADSYEGYMEDQKDQQMYDIKDDLRQLRERVKELIDAYRVYIANPVTSTDIIRMVLYEEIKKLCSNRNMFHKQLQEIDRLKGLMKIKRRDHVEQI
jgi:hypothetical protein